MRETLQVKVSPLVHPFWEETGTDLTMACIKLCWEPTPRAINRKRENDPTAHVITFLDELAVWVPTLDAWDQLLFTTHCGCTVGPYRSRAVWLLPWSGGRPQPRDASDTIPGHRRGRSLPMCGEGPGVQGECLGI